MIPRPVPISPYGAKASTHDLVNDLDHQAAARTDGNVLAVAQVRDADFKLVAAGTWIVVDLQGRGEGHVFDLDLVVDGHGGRLMMARVIGGSGCESKKFGRKVTELRELYLFWYTTCNRVFKVRLR